MLSIINNEKMILLVRKKFLYRIFTKKKKKNKISLVAQKESKWFKNYITSSNYYFK